MSLLRRTFNPTDKEVQTWKNRLKEIEKRIPHTVNLVSEKDGNILLVSEPFQRFGTDCSYCSYYHDLNVGFSEGGQCTKHNITCGWGFTCKDWRS